MREQRQHAKRERERDATARGVAPRRSNAQDLKWIVFFIFRPWPISQVRNLIHNVHVQLRSSPVSNPSAAHARCVLCPVPPCSDPPYPAPLRFAPLRPVASLRSAPLRSASLCSASLRSASLRSASLRFASLRLFTLLRFAALRCLVLRCASLRLAVLRFASLRFPFTAIRCAVHSLPSQRCPLLCSPSCPVPPVPPRPTQARQTRPNPT